jgi:hypothetical protein
MQKRAIKLLRKIYTTIQKTYIPFVKSFSFNPIGYIKFKLKLNWVNISPKFDASVNQI